MTEDSCGGGKGQEALWGEGGEGTAAWVSSKCFPTPPVCHTLLFPGYGRAAKCQTLAEISVLSDPGGTQIIRKPGGPLRTMAPTPILQTRPLRHRKEKALVRSHTPGTRTQILTCPHSPPAVRPHTIPGPWGGVPTLTQAMTEYRTMFPRTATPGVSRLYGSDGPPGRSHPFNGTRLR